MTNVPPVPIRVPLLDEGGFLTQVWADWFQKVFLRVGGTQSRTNDELYDDLYPVDSARILNGAVLSAAIASSVAGAGLSGGAGSPLGVNVDGATLEIDSDTLRVKDGGIPFAKFLSTDWTNSIGSSGRQKLPSGLILQWGVTGSVSSGATSSVSLPVTFPTALRQAFVSIRDNSAVATSSTGQAGTGNYSASGFDIYNRTSVAQVFNWFAVGN